MKRVLALLLVMAAAMYAAPKFLMPDEAFKPSAHVNKKQQVEFIIELADSIYVYDEKVQVIDADLDDGIVITSISRPKPTELHDELVYTESPKLVVTLASDRVMDGVHKAALTLEYQGCSQQGLCYEPISKTFTLNINTSALETAPQSKTADAVAATSQKIADANVNEPASKTANASVNEPTPKSESDTIADTLKEGNIWFIIMTFFGFGLLLALTPCVFPMIPILSSVIVAQGKNITTKKAFMMSLVYVLAMAVAYTIAGVLAGLFGANLQAAFQTPWVIVVFSLIFVALSLSMFDYYELQMPQFVQSRLNKVGQERGGYMGVALMGFFSALIVGPCVAAPLAGALIYIGQTGDALLGGIALFSLSIGMGMPLLLIGLSAGKFMPKPGAWMEAIKSIFGVMLLGVAIWMLSRVIPEPVTLLLWSFLLIATAVNMGAFESVRSECPRCPKSITKSIGIIIFMFGMVLFLGGVTGAKNPLNPLEKFVAPALSSTALVQENSFKTITSLNELDAILASSKGKRVLVDFYADWCVACKELEHTTFSDPAVKAKMGEFVLVRADVTANGEREKALSKQYGVFGPPVVLFFDKNGKLMKGRDIVGFVEPEIFLKHLNAL
jgi:thioredoxin:protein disulfide reductase